jgi:7-keto-8-aminopelargonate synthetase-like enzyme
MLHSNRLMSKHHSFTNTVDQIVTHGVNKGILHLYTEDQSFEENHIQLKEKKVINFGSCSYLGLEFDNRLKDAAKNAIDRFGTQFSESRAYVSIHLYKELEHLLDKVFEAYCVVTPTTTLGHIANVPIMVEDGAAVIMDHQLHNCVQTAVQLVKARGVHTELIRHNRMDLLEERILALRPKHQTIWYMADGIYSMYGDACPVDEVYALMDKYPQLHFYVDDAHGMSIHGKNGRGFALNNREMHAKMVIGTSLNKAFAAGGGVLVYPNQEAARKVRTCGGPLLSSGPMQPSSLGAAIAAAKIHLSPEIYLMQAALQDKLQFTRQMLEKYRLPVFSQAGAAVFFVGVSLPKLGYNMVDRMLRAGYYINLGIFPTVPMKNTGLRFTITRLHTYAQIEKMIACMSVELNAAMAEENITFDEIYKAFKVPVPVEMQDREKSIINITQSGMFRLEHCRSISELKREEWNNLFGDRGSFDWNGLRLLENAFKDNLSPEENWDFDYILIRDISGKIVLATFLTTSIWKDDMLSTANISRQVEVQRLHDPYYLTSRVISTGSLLTEGDHIYINKTNEDWKQVMALFFEKLYSLQESNEADNIVLRDFHGLDPELDNLLVENGFFRVTMPDTNIVEYPDYNRELFLYGLSQKARNQARSTILRHENEFTIDIITDQGTDEETEHWFKLYRQVKERGLELNTFGLPKKLFQLIAKDPNWEIIQLSLPYESSQAVAVLFSYKTATSYVPTIIGLDYKFNKSHNVYRQALYQAIKRAGFLKVDKVLLGFTADMEKKKLGATQVKVYSYVHSRDGYNMQVLGNSTGNQ